MLRIWITWKQIDLIGPSLTQKENLLRFMSTDDLVCSRASSYKCFIFPYRSPSIINQVLGNLSAECILNLFVLWTIIWILTNRPDLKSASSGHARMVPRTHKTRWWGALAKFWYQKQITRLPNVFMKSISQHFIAKVLLLQVLCAPLKIRKLLVVYQEILWNLTLDIHKSAFFYFFYPQQQVFAFISQSIVFKVSQEEEKVLSLEIKGLFQVTDACIKWSGSGHILTIRVPLAQITIQDTIFSNCVLELSVEFTFGYLSLPIVGSRGAFADEGECIKTLSGPCTVNLPRWWMFCNGCELALKQTILGCIYSVWGQKGDWSKNLIQ